MATNANQYVVNLVDLQNIATSITGNASNQAITQLQADVGNLQQMVNYNTKTVSTDTLTEFTQGHGINVISELTTTSITSNTDTVNQGTMAFEYSSSLASFTGLVSGSLPSSFASSVVAAAQTITITLQSTYSTTNFPSYTGIVYWYTNGGYLSLSIPNANVIFTGTQITINLFNQLPGAKPDASGFSVWLTLRSFN